MANSFGVLPSVPYNLVLAGTSRGVTYEVSSNNDWALLSNDPASKGCPVILREKGTGYTVQSTNSNWGGYSYWGSFSNGVKLVTEANATTWTLKPGPNGGFYIADTSDNSCTYATNGKGWLTPRNTILPNSGSDFASWQAVKA